MENQIDHESAIPKYLQLQEILAGKIQSGQYKVGEKLSTDAALKQLYRLSTSTVTRALSELEDAGFVTRKQGAGTFVKSLAGAPAHSLPGQARRRRLLLICGAAPDFGQAHENVNWFIGHEIYRGLVNTFDGRVRIVQPEELPEELDDLPAETQGYVAAVNRRSAVFKALGQRKTPYVIIDQQGQTGRVCANTISLDHVRGVYDAMGYLLDELGHRDVAFIGPRRDEVTVQHRGRWSGYCLGLQAFNLPLREELLVYAESGSLADGYRATQALLGRGVKFTAVFVSTDIKAIGAIRALRDAGLKVPEDVSVIGFDDIPGADKNDPPLTTVRLPYFEAGAAAVKLLDTAPDAAGALPGQVLASRLVVRASCASVKSRVAGLANQKLR